MTTLLKNTPTATDKDECELLSEIASRDRAALSRLYVAYHGRLFKFIFRLTHSHALSDELVNDVMLLVWQKAHTFRGESRVSTWIFGIAYRVTMRRVTRKKLALAPMAMLDNLSDERDTSAEDKDWIMHGIADLPTAQQITVMLVFYVGLSYEETAEVTECPVNTVKTRMFHARRKLKELLQDHAQPTHMHNGDSHD